jgi:hypothetical protein
MGLLQTQAIFFSQQIWSFFGQKIYEKYSVLLYSPLLQFCRLQIWICEAAFSLQIAPVLLSDIQQPLSSFGSRLKTDVSSRPSQR